VPSRGDAIRVDRPALLAVRRAAVTRPCFLCRILFDHDGPCMETDLIGALCYVVKQAGLTMTLYGKPVSGPEELRAKAFDHAITRIVAPYR
jgi:hypothetical protein